MWKVVNKISVFKTPWVKLIGERVEDDEGKMLDYWRVEKEDSVVVIPVWKDHILLPPKYYRHGAGEYTYDFPGGRILEKESNKEAGLRILNKELGVSKDQIKSLSEINSEGFLINSSFSDQKIYGYVADISEKVSWQDENIEFFRDEKSNTGEVLNKFICLQCRAIFLEWIHQRNNS
jgi:hypothetical protein